MRMRMVMKPTRFRRPGTAVGLGAGLFVATAWGFNNDGQTDILWRNYSTGENAVWYMNGRAYLSTATIQSVSDTDWEIVGTGYFNADGNIDLLWRNRVTGDNAIWFMNGVTQSGFTDIQAQPDVDWRVVGTGDFNNDGQTDILWRHATTGQNAVWYMN